MKLEKLTKSQEPILDKVKDDWIKFALLDGDEVNEKAARQGVEWLYHISGLKKPITIIVDSPLGVQYGVYFAKELLKTLGKEGVRSQVWSQVGSQVWSQVESQGLPYETFASDTLSYWGSWIAWAEAFEKLGVVKHSDYKKYKKFMRSGVFMGAYLDGLAVVCRRPSVVRRDDEAELFSDCADKILSTIASRLPEKKLTGADKLRAKGYRVVGSNLLQDAENNGYNQCLVEVKALLEGKG